MNKQGRFIVIEGVDGSGKETQAKMLVDHFKETGIRVLYLDFPQYEGFYGQVVARYLRGEFGPIESTSPYLISIIYALDRSTVKNKIEKFLQEGGVVVANRYVPSNIAHQTANNLDESRQKEFISWIQQLEYDQLGLPREDLVLYLDLPYEIGIQRSNEKLIKGTHHDYLKGKADIHEQSVEHRKKTADIYGLLLSQNKHWHKIISVDSTGAQRSAEDLHKEILTLLK